MGDKLKKILIITNSIDNTATYISNKYAKDASFFRLNVDLFNNYSININQDEVEIIDLESKNNITSSEIHSVYYRNITFPSLSDYNPLYHGLMKSEIMAIIKGIAESVGTRALTRPSTLARADNKIVQLLLAKKVGFVTPKSLITNDDMQANGFIEDSNFKIVKPISCGKILHSGGMEIIQTNMIEEKKVEGLEKSPAYFQDYIGKKYELRVTVINQVIFPVKIISNDPIDWRSFNNEISYSIDVVSKDIQEKILLMMDELNIKFAAFDFIIDCNDNYVFLELNANGQWQWLEQELGIPISEEIINYLTGEGKI